MKFTFLLVLLFPLISLAFYFPVGKNGANTSYKKKSDCEKIEGQSCYSIKGIDYRVAKVSTRMADDTSMPKWTKEDVKSCVDKKSCQEILKSKDCSAYPGRRENQKARAIVDKEFTEVYCAAFNGFEKVQEEFVEEDPAKKAAMIKDRQDKEADKLAKLKQASDLMQECFTDWGTIQGTPKENQCNRQSFRLMRFLVPLVGDKIREGG